MTQRLPVPSAPGPLEAYCHAFDPLFAQWNQRDRFRRYLEGLLLPTERNKTLTALATTEPIVGAQHPQAQSLQWFLSESTWDAAAVNERRIAALRADSVTAPTADGVLVIDEHGDRKWGSKTAHIGKHYLANLGKIDTGRLGAARANLPRRPHRDLVGAGGGHRPVRPHEAVPGNRRNDRSGDVARSHHLVPHHQSARSRVSASGGDGRRASGGPGRDCAAVWLEELGGAKRQADKRGAGLERVPGALGYCHPAALGLGLLRFLVLLVSPQPLSREWRPTSPDEPCRR